MKEMHYCGKTCISFLTLNKISEVRDGNPSKIRLEYRGVLMIDYGKELLGISSRYWNNNNVKVACRQLGLASTHSQVLTGRKTEWLLINRHFNCTGRENNIASCPFYEWTGFERETYEYQAAIECLGGKYVTLYLRISGGTAHYFCVILYLTF